jgi:ATP adenylyltransferase
MRMCPYCLIGPATIVAANKLVVAVRNASPLAPLHTLILPRRHVPNYFELYLPEMMGVDEIMRQVSEDICASDGTVRGFNIGISVGGAAGQTVPHCCVDLIPRRLGDCYSFEQRGVRHHSRLHAVIDRISAPNYPVVGNGVSP